MDDNIFNKLYRGSGAGREGSYLNPESQWTPGDSGYDSFEINSGFDPGSQKPTSARDFARIFDPTSNEDVFTLQGMLGLKQDGILGRQTLKALRELQGVPLEEEGYNYDGSEKQSFMDKMTDDEGLFQGGDKGRLFGRLRDAGGGLLAKLGMAPKSQDNSSDY